MRGSRGPVGRNLGPPSLSCHPAAAPQPQQHIGTGRGPSQAAGREPGGDTALGPTVRGCRPFGPGPARPGHRPSRREPRTAGGVTRSAAPVRAGASAPGERTGVRRSRAAVQASPIRRQHGPGIRREEREGEGRSPRRPALAPHSRGENGQGSAGLPGTARGWQPRSPGCLTAVRVGAAAGTAGRAPAANGLRSSSQVGIRAIQARMHPRSVQPVPSPPPTPTRVPPPGLRTSRRPRRGAPAPGARVPTSRGLLGAVHNAGSPGRALRLPRAPAGTTALPRAGFARGRPQVTRGWHLSAGPGEAGAGHVGPRAEWKRTLRPAGSAGPRVPVLPPALRDARSRRELPRSVPARRYRLTPGCPTCPAG